MEPIQEAYANELVRDKASSLKKGSTDGKIFGITREVSDILVEADIVLDADTPIRIYKALIEYRNSLK